MQIQKMFLLTRYGKQFYSDINIRRNLKLFNTFKQYTTYLNKQEIINNNSQSIDEKKKNDNINFCNKYVDFFRDESRNIGILTFKNICDKKNIFPDFLEELKNVVDHINNIISNEENNKFYINEFKNKDNYLVKNLKKAIPYYDNKLKVLIINGSDSNFRKNCNTFLNSIDFSSYLKCDEGTNVDISSMFRIICNNIQQLPLITISNINGICYNSGMDIILSTDFRISNENSKYGYDKTYIGLYPYGGSIQKLFRHIPMNYSKYLLLTSQTINAFDALKFNLIDICINQNDEFYINNSNVNFDNNLTKKNKINIIKENIIKYFNDIFINEHFKLKANDDSFIFTLFFAFQFLFTPTYILQNIKMSINEGMLLSDSNAYLDCDRMVFEKSINTPERLEILNYLKTKKISEYKPKEN
ncbi:hypothetical protein YYC_03089 [Plasmodium yoelii 17X]|nr:enoyl-CoA hydratase [Plasmodium yoelii]ETB59660.1 hypothetical protein YYC_03089 [Plasmodium yoelii 17X]CDU85046.1 enoyl-CoA hydratase, putative [Plasmodium yoelii]VTZ78942.1 enoyl-CoA hydratase, putative [Plasmodium yoelii]|eukprot:XP_727551.2 enoyl-CoA hydratase [Plasmodium yoelii]